MQTFVNFLALAHSVAQPGYDLGGGRGTAQLNIPSLPLGSGALYRTVNV